MKVCVNPSIPNWKTRKKEKLRKSGKDEIIKGLYLKEEERISESVRVAHCKPTMFVRSINESFLGLCRGNRQLVAKCTSAFLE
jgi:hypothetical protein